jgi:hypothetical protein
MARALLKQRGMPAKLWGEEVVTAVHLLNRSPTKSLLGKTSYEAWHGRAPAVGHLCMFGCLTFAKELNQVKKLDDRSRPRVFIGYADGTKAYRVLDPETQCVRVSRDVVFDESRDWDWTKVGESSASAAEEFTVEYLWSGGVGGAQGASPSASLAPPRSPSLAPGEPGNTTAAAATPPPLQPASPMAPSAAASPASSASPASPTATPLPADHLPVELATPLEDDEDHLDAFYDDKPLRYRTVTNIIDDESPPGLASRLLT